jgi:alpha-L-arabinofuranosidase
MRPEPRTEALIRVDLDRTIGHVDRRIFGAFIEHLGRCIYGGIFDEGSQLSDEHGFRTDVLQKVKQLGPPVLRWPGGNFVSGYHWTDGIGPRDARPRRAELAWGSEESNRFGTDEFIAYCRAIETAPFICINMGTGSLDEAQAWVEYCNGTGNTYWANRRRQNGHAEPYAVRYWGLGNEMYGSWQIGALEAHEYVAAARRFAKLMLATDPTVELISCGQWGFTDWDRIVIDGLADLVRYHSIHLYTGSSDYLRNVLQPHQADRALRVCEALIERARYTQHISHSIGIAYDEWNVWYKTRSAAGRSQGLEERYDLSDALAVACFLNVFVRHCRSVELANIAQLVNVIAPVFTSPDGLFLQTIYHPLHLYAAHTQSIALDPLVTSPTLTPSEEATAGPDDRDWQIADLGPFSALDVIATRDAERGTLVLGVTNRDPVNSIPAALEIVGTTAAVSGRVFEINGPDVQATNSFEHPDAVNVRERGLEDGATRWVFPAHSISVLRLQL